MAFVTEPCGEGVSIRAYEGSSRVLVIPEQIGGRMVCGISAHALEGRAGLCEVRLPSCVRSIGSFAFHSCPDLARLVLTEETTDLGSGVVRHCDALQDLELFAPGGNFSVLRDLLQDFDGMLRVRITGESDLLLTFPAWNYDFRENTMARKIQFSIEGMGYSYRQCVSRRRIDLAEYDRLFGRLVSQDARASVEIAVGRLLHPQGLSEQARGSYEQYLMSHAAPALEYFLRQERTEAVQLYCSRTLIPRQALEEVLPLACDLHLDSCVALLMEYRRRHFGRVVQQAFSLDDF